MSQGKLDLGDMDWRRMFQESPEVSGAMLWRAMDRIEGYVNVWSDPWIDHSADFTATGWTAGNNTVVSRYTQIGSVVHWSGSVTIGSTGEITGTFIPALPVTAKYSSGHDVGSGWCLDSGTTTTTCVAYVNSAVQLAFLLPGGLGNVDATAPWDWTTSDRIRWSITYEADMS